MWLATGGVRRIFFSFAHGICLRFLSRWVHYCSSNGKSNECRAIDCTMKVIPRIVTCSIVYCFGDGSFRTEQMLVVYVDIEWQLWPWEKEMSAWKASHLLATPPTLSSLLFPPFLHHPLSTTSANHCLRACASTRGNSLTSPTTT